MHYLNGQPLAGAGSPSIPIINSDLRIGQAENHNFFNGDMAEVLIYDHAVSSTDQGTLESYLQSKYSLGGSSGGATAAPLPPDITPPSTPSNLSSTIVSASQVDLSWTASSDDSGVVGYKIYRNGAEIASTSKTSYSDNSLVTNMPFTYTVAAFDLVGNLSGEALPLTVVIHDYYNGVAPILKIVSGDGQVSSANGTFLPLALAVQVSSTNGTLLANAPLTFTVTQGSGQLAVSTNGSSLTTSLNVQTSSNGVAQLFFMSPAVIQNTDQITASPVSVANYSTKATFSENVGVFDLPQSGMTLWLKSDDGITKDASNMVHSWADQSGNGFNAAQSDASASPLWVDSVANGKPVVRFDGQKSFLSAGDKPGMALTNFSFFVVAAFHDVNSVQALLSKDEGGGPVPKWIYWFIPNSMDFHVQPATFHCFSPLVPKQGQFMLLEFIKNDSSSMHYLNGQPIAGAGNPSIPIINSDLRIGQAEGHNFFNGDISEIFIYNLALPDQDRISIENYSKSKYNIGP